MLFEIIPLAMSITFFGMLALAGEVVIRR